jgi:hypothetical protein
MAFKDYFKEFQPLQVNEDILLRQIDVEHDIHAYIEMYNDEAAFSFYEGYGKLRDNQHQGRLFLYSLGQNVINPNDSATTKLNISIVQ